MANQTDKFNTGTVFVNGQPVTNWSQGGVLLKDGSGRVIKNLDLDPATRQARYRRVIKEGELGQRIIGVEYTGDSSFGGGGSFFITKNVGDTNDSTSPYVTQIVAGPGLFVGPGNGKGQVLISTQPIPNRNVDSYYADYLSVSWTISHPSYPLNGITDNSQFLIGGTGGAVMRSRDGVNFVDLMGPVNSPVSSGDTLPSFELTQLQGDEFPDAGLVYWSYRSASSAPTVTLPNGQIVVPGHSSLTPLDLQSTGTIRLSILEEENTTQVNTYFPIGTSVQVKNDASLSAMFGTISRNTRNVDTGVLEIDVNIVTATGTRGNYGYWSIARVADVVNLQAIQPQWGRLNKGYGVTPSTLTNLIIEGDSLSVSGNYVKRSDNSLSNIPDEIIHSSGFYYQPSIQANFTDTLHVLYGQYGGIYRVTNGLGCKFDNIYDGQNNNTQADREHFDATATFCQSASDCADTLTNEFRVIVTDAKNGRIFYSDRVGNGVGVWDTGNELINGTPTEISGTPLWAAAYGNQVWIAAGDDDTVYVSDDGQNWTRTSTGWPGTNWRSAAYGNGRFVLVGQKGRIMWSGDDGNTWSKTDVAGGKTVTGAWQNLNAIAYSPKLDVFCIVGDGRSILSFKGSMLNQPVSQNGVKDPTPEGSKTSNFGLIVSSTQTTYGSTLVLKAISDAALYKTVPVSFYSNSTSTYIDTSTVTLLGTSTFINTTDAPLVTTNLSTGTHYLYATWPGEGNYGEVTTQGKQIKVDISAGYDIGGDMSIEITPASNTLVVGEGTATITVNMTTSTTLPGNIQFFNDQIPLGTVPLLFNSASLDIDTLPAGNLNIRTVWSGAIINDIQYQGKSTSTVYTVKSGTNTFSNLTLDVIPTYGVYQEGDITLTAQLTTSTSLPGNITFYANDEVIYTAPIENNGAILTIPNTYAVGTSTFQATYDGNQASHPRYIPLISPLKNFNIYARDTVGGPDNTGTTFMSMTITPNPSAFLVNTRFRVTFNTSTQIVGNVSIIDTGVYSGVVGTAPIVNNIATFETSSLTTGTHNVYAYYPGSSTAPKFYPSRSDSQSLVVEQGIGIPANLVLTVASDSYLGTGEPFVAGETTFLTASITTGTNLGGVVNFYNGTTYLGTANMVNNSASTSTVFTTTGAKTIRAVWPGRLIGGSFYADKTSNAVPINVIQGYTLPVDISVTATTPVVISEDVTLTASATTSTKLANTVTFYINNQAVGTGQFNSTTNRATLVTSVASTGSYTTYAVWAGGNVEANRFYLPKTSTSTVFTATSAATIPNLSMSLSTRVTPQVITRLNTFTVLLNSGVNINGVDSGLVSLKNTANNSTITTGTFVNNSATFTIPAGQIAVGTYTLQAVWAGQSVAPKYYGTSSNAITQTVLAQSESVINLSISPNPFRVYNADRTTNNQTAASIRVTGIYNSVGAPTGSVQLYDGDLLLGSTTLSNPGQNYTATGTISWNPIAVGQVDSGTRTLSVVYSGNDWNKAKTTTSTNVFEALTRVAPTVPVLSYVDSGLYTQPVTFTSVSTPSKPTGSITIDTTAVEAFNVKWKASGQSSFGSNRAWIAGHFLNTSTAVLLPLTPSAAISSPIASPGYRRQKFRAYFNNQLVSPGVGNNYFLGARITDGYDIIDVYNGDGTKFDNSTTFASFVTQLNTLSSTGTVQLRVVDYEAVPAGGTLTQITADAVGVARYAPMNMAPGNYTVKSNVPADVAYYSTSSNSVVVEKAPLTPYMSFLGGDTYVAGNSTRVVWELLTVPDINPTFVPNQLMNVKIYYRWRLAGTSEYIKGPLFKSTNVPINGNGQPTNEDAVYNNLPYGYFNNRIYYYPVHDGYPGLISGQYRTITYNGQQYEVQGYHFEISYTGGANIPASDVVTGYCQRDQEDGWTITGV